MESLNNPWSGPVKVGDAQWTPAQTRLPENLGYKPLELVLIELKRK